MFLDGKVRNYMYIIRKIETSVHEQKHVYIYIYIYIYKFFTELQILSLLMDY